MSEFEGSASRTPPEKRKKTVYFTLAPGSHQFTGPRGDETSHSYAPPFETNVTVKVLTKRAVRGEGISFYVEAESPPEMQGKRFWVAPKPGKNTGFY